MTNGTTRNLKAVPLRDMCCMESISDEIILHMKGELADELQLLQADLRDLGARRNGLAQVEKEIMLRELEEI